MNKAACAKDAPAEARDIDVPVLINLACAHERRVQAAATVEIKLAGVRDDRRRMRRDAEVDAASRHAAVNAGFDRESNPVGQPGFGDRRAATVARNAGAKVDGIAMV